MKSLNVLCVDDEPEVFEGLKRSLRKLPYRVVGAPTAQDALGLLSRMPFDVALVDEYMPGMLGSRLLEEMRERWPATLRVAMTGMPGAASTQRLCGSGAADSLLVKPFGPERLAQVLGLARRA